jgi:hypothetical protein
LQRAFAENGQRKIPVHPELQKLTYQKGMDQRLEDRCRKLTVEEVFGQRVVGHELGDEQPFVPVAAVADQVRQPPVPQLADALGLLLPAHKQGDFFYYWPNRGACA